MCGQKKIDGYVFCTGMESFNISYKTRQELQRLIRLVTYLIREAIYRPEYSTEITSGGMGLEICPLSGLLDMYHAQKATKRHDKVYALLSMSSDGDLRDAGLSPNYAISWEELFQRLIKHLLPGRMSVQTCESREVAIIKSKGRILGKVVEIQRDPVRGDRLLVEVALQKTLIQMGQTENWSNHWSIQMSAKRIQKGDFICVFEGALKPAICRLNGDYFTIIVLEVLFSDDSPRRSRSFEQKASLLSETHSSGDFLLVWNWENSLSDSEDPEDYESWIRTNHWEPEQTTAGPKGYLARARRFWNVVLVLEDIVPGWANSTEYEEMEQRGREVIINCEMALGAEHPPDPERRSDYSPPSCTTRDSCDTVVDLLCTGIRMTSSGNYEVSRVRLLSWAAEGNHKAVVELLLRTGKIDLNIRTISAFQQWPLYIAVYEGHKTIVELLLKLGDLNMYTKTLAAGVLLSLSAERGHEDVLSTLLEAWPEIFNSENYLGLDPLWVAASKGFGDTVQQLLKTTKFQVDAKGIHGQTPLSKASAAGHAAVVKLLLSTGEVNPDSKDNNERTPLWLAASEGHAAVVKLLLETDKVEVNSTNQYKETPLSRAVLGGHEAIVRLLLETRKVDFRAKDGFSLQTPLSLAAERGYETIVQLMLEKGNFDISMEDGFSSQSPLSRAAKGGHEAVVKLLLEAEIVAIKGRNLPLPPSHPLH
jgi:ankyrin repeat protein